MILGRVVVAPIALLLVACGSSNKPEATAPRAAEGTGESATAGPSPREEPAVASEPAAPKLQLSDEAILGRMSDDLLACYTQGKKAAPKMADGKVTFLASVDAGGKASCVAPMDDTGLTQEVEDCMGARLAREAYEPGAAWTFELPLVVKRGAVALGKEASGPSLDHVETHGLPDGSRVVQSVYPTLSECTQGADAASGLRVLHIGARVGSDGRVVCALAAGATPVPESLRSCAQGKLASVRFAAPPTGSGLVSIPMKILGSR